jgi:hypothetical protein
MDLPKIIFCSKYRETALLLSLLLTSCFVYSQDRINEVEKKFNRYRIENLQEKVFIHADKDFYLPGEIIWFAIYVVDAQKHQSLDMSKVAYVEIIAKDTKRILQAKVELENGHGNGSFLLPASIASGNYLIRAYTSWMKNYSSEFYFEKPITLVNPLKAAGKQTEKDSLAYDFQLFPEGGNLVNNLESKIAFRLNDKNGKGINGVGYVLNDKNDTVSQFKSHLFGIGNFLFTPKKGNSYKAIMKLENKLVLSKELPTGFDKGWVMKLTDVDSAAIKITVNAAAAGDGLPVYLFAHSRMGNKFSITKELESGTTTFDINKKLLSEGITHFTIFNAQGLALCERLFFKAPVKVMEIQTTTDQATYGTRKKVNIQLQAAENNQLPVNARMSLSVFMIDSLQKTGNINIVNYLYLLSDLKGNIESPDYYFNTTSVEAIRAADNLMLTHGWRRFKWQDILAEIKTPIESLAETEGHIIKVKALDVKTKMPIANANTYLSIPGKYFQIQSATSNVNGELFFNLKNFYGANDAVLTTTALSGKHQLDIINPFSEKPCAIPIPAYTFFNEWGQQLLNRSISIQSDNAYNGTEKQKFDIKKKSDTVAFYGNPYKTYLLDDYTRFLTMEEVVQEYVTEVRLKKLNEKSRLAVFNLPYKTFFQNEPLVLLDGVPLTSANTMVAFDPLKIKKIEVVPNKYYRGISAEEGIVSLHTFEGDLAGLTLDSTNLVIAYEGMQLERIFYSPKYETTAQLENRAADFRNLLYWTPLLKTDNEGKGECSFFTSDLPGNYVVVVNAIGANGLVASKAIKFTVYK